ncbi:chaplin [Streptomyces sp. NPDC127092]|uniref:chaplin n=1 Tax=Streptomyces sp. NPDC127092 TaxID=3347135 RepID=UPI00364C7526
MRQIGRSGLATLLVTGGALALSAGAAHADSAAQGAAAGSPGVGSGNAVQLPVHVPVNVCGNTVNVVGLLNPAAGNSCANRSGSSDHGSEDRAGGRAHKDLPGTPRAGSSDSGSRGGGGSGHGGAHNGGAHSGGGASAGSHAEGSPGVLSGNGIQLPVDLPVNVSGNSVNVVGIGNPAFGNTSVNESGPEEECEHPETPTPRPQTPVRNLPPAPSTEQLPGPAPQSHSVQLASTGADSLGYAAPASAALLLGGALLYRRARRAAADQA